MTTNFTLINDWVESNLRDLTAIDDLTIDKIKELEELYPQQDMVYVEGLQRILASSSNTVMETVSSVRVPYYKPDAENRKDNMFSGLIKHFDPQHRETNYFGFVVVPNFYTLRFYIVTKDDKVILTTIEMRTWFESHFIKPARYMGAPGGDVWKEMFDFKTKVDDNERLDPVYEPPKEESENENTSSESDAGNSGDTGTTASTGGTSDGSSSSDTTSDATGGDG